jgi:hypothetical protein
MLREISPRQFREWKQYYELEPFGERLQDYRTGHLVQAMYNIVRDPKTHPAPFELYPFIPQFGEYDDAPEKPVAPAPPKQTWEEQKVWAKLYVKAFNSEN